MNKDDLDNNMDEEEIFHQAYNSFIEELNALSQSPEITSELEGHYNVAYEFWYLLPNQTLLQNTQGLLTDIQVKRIKDLFNYIKQLPEEAYTWTDVAEESLLNMQHPAWEPVRKQAKELVILLAPVTKLNHQYYFEL